MNKIKINSKVLKLPEAPDRKLELRMPKNGPRTWKKPSLWTVTVGLEGPVLNFAGNGTMCLLRGTLVHPSISSSRIC